MKTVFLISFLVVLAVGCSIPMRTSNNSVANAEVPLDQRPEVQRVTIESADEVILVGSFFESKKPNSPALLLLHQWQSDRHAYDDLARKLQARNINVLSIDGRGFGESTSKVDGTSVSAGRSRADVSAMLGDVDASVQFLKKQPSVNANRLGIVGASYGSSLAIIYAADHAEIVAVALLSPGLNYLGALQTEPAVKKFEEDYPKRRLLFFAAGDDKESAEAVRKLNPFVVDNFLYAQRIFPSGGHGTALLKIGADQNISDFFADVFDLANLNNLNR
jgi:dienelactone hydrolase